MSSLTNLAQRLYNGDVSYDFVGKRRTWYIVSAVFLLIALGGLLGRGLNLGIEFKGGAQFTVSNTTASIEQAREVVEALNVGEVNVSEVGNDTIRIQTPPLTTAQTDQVVDALIKELPSTADNVSSTNIGPTWGAEITQKAVQGLVVFLILLTIFLSLYFEWRMALAAIVAVVHDVLITVGIYALTGLEVTPATVVGVLTILGFSLYDTVVVFDKVKENTAGIFSGSRQTYGEAANDALNQTLVRSINTTVVAVLPVLAILVVAVGILRASSLNDLALALFIGMLAGTYSSIFIATPFLVQLKERTPEAQALTKRVAARRSGLVDKQNAAKARKAAAAGAAPSGPSPQPKAKRKPSGK
jgi:preprotein translocase subunit SecF